MKRFTLYGLACVLLLGAFTMTSGCSLILSGAGEFGIKQSTTWSFYQLTQKEDVDDKSEIEIEAQSFEAWLFSSKTEEVSVAEVPD